MKLDDEAIKSIHHHCTGCRSRADCCCASYDILISPTEMQRILNIFPLLVAYCPDLMVDGAFDNVFEEAEEGLIRVDTDEGGLCVFAYRQEGLIRCALHSVALATGRPLEKVKPFHCLLWPLAVSSGSEPVVSVQQNAFDFSCNRRKQQPHICKSLKETLRMLFPQC